MITGRDMPREVSRAFIPERQYWTPEAAATYLDDNGLFRQKKDGSPDFELLEVPLIDKDDYPIVDILARNAILKSLFVEDAKFPRIYEKRSVYSKTIDGLAVNLVTVTRITTSDNVDHVQGQKNFMNGQGKPISRALWNFCDNDERKVRIPFGPHNVLTRIFDDPPGPKTGLDENLAIDHAKGANLNIDYLEAAIEALKASKPFNARKRAIENRAVTPGSRIDPLTGIDEDSRKYLSAQHKEKVEAFLRVQEKVTTTRPDSKYFAPIIDSLADAKPSRVIAVLSQVATRQPWDHTSFMRNSVDESTLMKRHKNKLIRQTARAAKLQP